MRTYDFAPLFRSTIGLDRLLDLLDTSTIRSDWPSYNIEKSGEASYRIRMALAGFGPRDVAVIQQGNVLTITGQKAAEHGPQEVLHRGLAFRDFKQAFSLANHVKVVAASLDDGLLAIDLVREVPEELKPRRIEIGGTSRRPAVPSQDNQPKLTDQQTERLVKAA